MRDWKSHNEEEAVTSWFYFWRYINPLPLGLQAFVICDDDGLHVATDHGTAPLFDPSHLQPYQNIGLAVQSDDELRQLVITGEERIRREIELVENKTDAVDRSVRIVGARRQYALGQSTFSEVGPRRLFDRARQRFFFLLAAEEILDALTEGDPQKKLDTTWYGEHSGALRAQLFIKNNQVHLSPPLLFLFVVDVEVTRIHKCDICRDYFWAGRKDKKVCSPQCGATKRKRRERDRYMEVKLGDRIPKNRKVKTKSARLEAQTPVGKK